MLVIITGVSGSGKTSVVDELMKTGRFTKPLNFTTRKPRNDAELDDYVFLTKDMFESKVRNEDFSEFTYYNGNYYGMTKFLSPEKDYLLIMEPAGRAMLEKWARLNDVPFIKVFLDISQETVIRRLEEKRGESVEFIRERLKDFCYFYADSGSIIIDGEQKVKKVADDTYRAIAQYEGKFVL